MRNCRAKALERRHLILLVVVVVLRPRPFSGRHKRASSQLASPFGPLSTKKRPRTRTRRMGDNINLRPTSPRVLRERVSPMDGFPNQGR
jgi:hypothetical protein